MKRLTKKIRGEGPSVTSTSTPPEVEPTLPSTVELPVDNLGDDHEDLPEDNLGDDHGDDLDMGDHPQQQQRRSKKTCWMVEIEGKS